MTEPRRSQRAAVKATYSDKALWDKVNKQANDIGKAEAFSRIKTKPKGTFLVANEAENHVAVWDKGTLYNSNDEEYWSVHSKVMLPPDGFDRVKAKRPMMARKECLNFGGHGCCRLVSTCILGALKTPQGKKDMMKLSGPDFVKKYARKRIREYMKNIGLV